MAPQVGLNMGSDSDWPTVKPAAELPAEFGVPFEVGVVSDLCQYDLGRGAVCCKQDC